MTLAEQLAGVDWTAPWLVPLRVAGQRVAARCNAGDTLAQALNGELAGQDHGAGGPRLAAGQLRFVAQAELPAGCAYEAFIAATASVPTRELLHDLFNGLAWLHWPRLKRRLNELQAEQIDRLGVGATRGAVRDALTLFDENAALLQLPAPLERALVARDWTALFVDLRSGWRDASVTLFGHALIEKLVTPRKAITAHAWLLPATLGSAQVEDWLCDTLTPPLLAGPQHHPLPVLGIPGWWPANQAPGFYADPLVFRPQRGRRPAAIIPL